MTLTNDGQIIAERPRLRGDEVCPAPVDALVMSSHIVNNQGRGAYSGFVSGPRPKHVRVMQATADVLAARVETEKRNENKR